MSMTIEQLDRMAEECERDIRRITLEIEQLDIALNERRELLRLRRTQREAWLQHPDRERQQ